MKGKELSAREHEAQEEAARLAEGKQMKRRSARLGCPTLTGGNTELKHIGEMALSENPDRLESAA
jgi:hypothetical protein